MNEFYGKRENNVFPLNLIEDLKNNKFDILLSYQKFLIQLIPKDIYYKFVSFTFLEES